MPTVLGFPVLINDSLMSSLGAMGEPLLNRIKQFRGNQEPSHFNDIMQNLRDYEELTRVMLLISDEDNTGKTALDIRPTRLLVNSDGTEVKFVAIECGKFSINFQLFNSEWVFSSFRSPYSEERFPATVSEPRVRRSLAIQAYEHGNLQNEMSPAPTSNVSGSERAIINSASVVAIASASAGVVSVIRNLIGSTKDFLDINKHLRERHEDSLKSSRGTILSDEIPPRNPE